MASLYVVTWFRRRAKRPIRYDTGWDRGSAAFLELAEALAEARRQEDLARELAGQGRDRDEDRANDLAISHVHATAYTLAGPPSLELLVGLVNHPPENEPTMTGGDWWDGAKVIRDWSGLSEARQLREADR